MADFDFSTLTPEQREKVKNLKSTEDVMKFIEEENIDLTDEQLSKISGGDFDKYANQVAAFAQGL